MKKICIVLAVLLVTLGAFADKPKFGVTKSGRPYCQYIGTVSRVYVNSYNVILVYFDTPIKPSEAGYFTSYYNNGEIGNEKVAAVYISDKPDFAKYFYATALMAQALNKQVEIQCYGMKNGHVVADHIWLNE